MRSISWVSWAACGVVLSQLSCREVPWPPDGEGGAGGEAGVGTGGTAAEGGSGTAPLVDPVLGCDADAWPAYASLEILPNPEFADRFAAESVRAISADGSVVVGDYPLVEVVNSEAIEGHRAIVFRSSEWEWVDAAALGRATVVNCDGEVVAGRLDESRAFIKTAGSPLVTIVPEEAPYWSAQPEDSSADGTRIAGNVRVAGPIAGRGVTNPVVWTNTGEPTFWKHENDIGQFEPPEPRSLFHSRFDGLLFSGASNGCSSGLFCPGPEDLFITANPSDETMHEDMPWSIASADLTTFSGYLTVPIFQNDPTVVHLFRLPDRYDVIPCPNEWCVAVALSSRGNVLLVSFMSPSYDGAAHIWTAQHGFRSVADLLALDGVDLEGRTLTAVDMSDDGRVITGHAIRENADGVVESNVYRAYLPLKTYE